MNLMPPSPRRQVVGRHLPDPCQVVRGPPATWTPAAAAAADSTSAESSAYRVPRDWRGPPPPNSTPLVRNAMGYRDCSGYRDPHQRRAHSPPPVNKLSAPCDGRFSPEPPVTEFGYPDDRLQNNLLDEICSDFGLKDTMELEFDEQGNVLPTAAQMLQDLDDAWGDQTLTCPPPGDGTPLDTARPFDSDHGSLDSINSVTSSQGAPAQLASRGASPAGALPDSTYSEPRSSPHSHCSRADSPPHTPATPQQPDSSQPHLSGMGPLQRASSVDSSLGSPLHRVPGSPRSSSSDAARRTCAGPASPRRTLSVSQPQLSSCAAPPALQARQASLPCVVTEPHRGMPPPPSPARGRPRDVTPEEDCPVSSSEARPACAGAGRLVSPLDPGYSSAASNTSTGSSGGYPDTHPPQGYQYPPGAQQPQYPAPQGPPSGTLPPGPPSGAPPGPSGLDLYHNLDQKISNIFDRGPGGPVRGAMSSYQQKIRCRQMGHKPEYNPYARAGARPAHQAYPGGAMGGPPQDPLQEQLQLQQQEGVQQDGRPGMSLPHQPIGHLPGPSGMQAQALPGHHGSMLQDRMATQSPGYNTGYQGNAAASPSCNKPPSSHGYDINSNMSVGAGMPPSPASYTGTPSPDCGPHCDPACAHRQQGFPPGPGGDFPPGIPPPHAGIPLQGPPEGGPMMGGMGDGPPHHGVMPPAPPEQALPNGMAHMPQHGMMRPPATPQEQMMNNLLEDKSSFVRMHPLFPLLRDLIVADRNFYEPNFPYQLLANLPGDLDHMLKNYLLRNPPMQHVQRNPAVDSMIMEALRYAHGSLTQKLEVKRRSEGVNPYANPLNAIEDFCDRFDKAVSNNPAQLPPPRGAMLQPHSPQLPSATLPAAPQPGNLPRSPKTEKSDQPKTSGRKHQVLPKEAVATMTEWLREHQDNPYPNDDEKEQLIQRTGLTINQINYWFTNARRRILPKWALQKYMQQQQEAGGLGLPPIPGARRFPPEPPH